MISCQDVDVRLRPFLRGELPFDQRLAVHRHLARCASCNRSVERARDAIDLSHRACASARDPQPDDVPDLLIRAIWTACQAR